MVTNKECLEKHERLDKRLNNIENNHLKHIEINIAEIKEHIKSLDDKFKSFEEFKIEVWTFMKKLVIIAVSSALGINLVFKVFGIV